MSNPNKQITVKQHFVPQFYLRRFVDQDGFLHIFNLTKKQLEKPKTAKHVCYEPYYYAIKTGEADNISQDIEDVLSDIENRLAPEIELAEKELLGTGQISPYQKLAIATLASMLWLRGRYMREQIRRMTEDLTKQMAKFRIGMPDFDKKMAKIYQKEGKRYTDEEREKIKSLILEEEYKVEISNQTHLKMILTGLEGFSNMFFGKYWRVYIAGSDKRFMTSDSPVTEWMPKRTTAYGTSFLERTHYLSLTPKIMIEMLFPLSTGKSVRRKTLHGDSDKRVDVLNILTANHSHGFLFSDSDDRLASLNSEALAGGSALQMFLAEFDNR